MYVFSLNLFWKLSYYVLLSWNGWWLSSSSIRWPHFQWWKKPKYTPGPYLCNISYTTAASFFRVISLHKNCPMETPRHVQWLQKCPHIHANFFALLLASIQNYIIDCLHWGRWNNHDLSPPAAKLRMNWMVFINNMVKTWPYCDKKRFHPSFVGRSFLKSTFKLIFMILLVLMILKSMWWFQWGCQEMVDTRHL